MFTPNIVDFTQKNLAVGKDDGILSQSSKMATSAFLSAVGTIGGVVESTFLTVLSIPVRLAQFITPKSWTIIQDNFLVKGSNDALASTAQAASNVVRSVLGGIQKEEAPIQTPTSAHTPAQKAKPELETVKLFKQWIADGKAQVKGALQNVSDHPYYTAAAVSALALAITAYAYYPSLMPTVVEKLLQKPTAPAPELPEVFVPISAEIVEESTLLVDSIVVATIALLATTYFCWKSYKTKTRNPKDNTVQNNTIPRFEERTPSVKMNSDGTYRSGNEPIEAQTKHFVYPQAVNWNTPHRNQAPIISITPGFEKLINQARNATYQKIRDSILNPHLSRGFFNGKQLAQIGAYLGVTQAKTPLALTDTAHNDSVEQKRDSRENLPLYYAALNGLSE